LGRSLDLYQLGEAESAHLGINPALLRIGTVALAALMVGACVAFTGIIGFVGLVVPHLVRLWLGPQHRALLPMAALVGAALLSAADLVARTVANPAELPIGVVTSAIGAPVFIGLLVGQTRSRGE
jgi:iron complex transport system permease protein